MVDRPSFAATDPPSDPMHDSSLDGSAIETRQLRNAVRQRLFGKKPEPIQIARFRVLKRVGSGGMGVVYAAYDNELDRKVAVKLLRKASRRRNARWRERFRREAQTLARLNHPNVVQIYESGEHDGQVFIAMEFVDGPSLRRWAERRRPDWREALGVMMEAGRGLAAAHREGLVHRDFKPENVVIGRDGRVRVLDFGLARVSEDAERKPSREELDELASQSLNRITRSDLLVGTPAYMAPEQFRRERADARTDQFAFCVTLYEMLYGERPFTGRTLGELDRAVHDEDVRPPNDARVPTWLRRRILRGLKADPERRYASMDELIDAVSRDPARLVRRGALTLAATVAVTSAGLFWRTSERAHVAQEIELRSQRDDERDRVLSLEDDLRQRLDRLTLAEVEELLEKDPTRALIHLSELSTGSEAFEGVARLLAADAIDRGISDRIDLLAPNQVPEAMSPDGRWLVTSERISQEPIVYEMRLFDVQAVPMTQRVLGQTRDVSNPGAVFGEIDGAPRLVVHAIDGEVVMWNGPDLLRRHELGPVSELVSGMDLSADARTLFVWDRTIAPVVIDLESSEQRALAGHESPIESLVPAARNADSFATWSMDGIAWWRPREPAPRRFPEATQTFAISGDGEMLAYIAPRGELRLAISDGPERTVRDGAMSPVVSLAFSPEGSLLAIGHLSGEIAIWNLEDDAIELRQPHTARVDRLAFSQDAHELMSSADDRTLSVWDWQAGRQRSLRGHAGVAYWGGRRGPSEAELVTVGWRNQVRHWSLPALAPPLPRRQAAVHQLHASAAHLLIASSTGIERWTPSAAGPTTLVEKAPSPISSAVSLGPNRIAFGDSNGDLHVLDARSKDRVVWRNPNGAGIDGLAVRPDGARLAILSTDASVHELHVDGSGLVAEKGSRHFELEDAYAVAIGYVGNALHGVVTDAMGQPAILELGASTTIPRPDGRLGRFEVSAAAFDPAGGRVAFGNFNYQVVVWSTAGLRVLGQHASIVRAAAFSPDGEYLATTAADGNLTLWHLSSGRSRTVALGDGGITSVAYVGDGGQIAVGSQSGVVHLVDDGMPDGELALRLRLFAASRRLPPVWPAATEN